MSAMLARLRRTLGELGLSVVPGEKPGELKLRGNTAAVTPEVMEAVKAFKPDLLADLGRVASPDVPRDDADARPDAIDPGPAPGEPEPPTAQTCGVCRAGVYLGPGVTAADIYAACGRAGQSAYGKRPAVPACPWKPAT